jgi:hypothetical protein
MGSAAIEAVNFMIGHAAMDSAALAGVLSRNSPAGLSVVSRMGLDRTSSNSSSAGEMAWAGIRRRISAGSDRGVLERRSPASPIDLGDRVIAGFLRDLGRGISRIANIAELMISI